MSQGCCCLLNPLRPHSPITDEMDTLLTVIKQAKVMAVPN
jgi:hypothetical protein